MRLLRSATLLPVLFAASIAAAQSGYQKPPKPVLDVLEAKVPPTLSTNPTADALLLMQPVRYPPIADLSQPMARLAGTRIDTLTNGEHGARYWVALTLQRIADGKQTPISLPAGARVGAPRWSADGKHFAFANVTASGIELWVGETSSGAIRKLLGPRLNQALDHGFGWLPDQHTLYVKAIPEGRGAPPPAPSVPPGPRIQEARGVAASNTYEARDVLRDEHDAQLFDYYASAEVVLVDIVTAAVSPLAPAAIYSRVAPAPDGVHLLVERVHRPYTYLHAFHRFPNDVEIWERGAARPFVLAKRPLAGEVPKDGVATGPRDYRWQPSAPATLLWTEALDGGDPKKIVPHRDRLLTSASPWKAPPRELFKTAQRLEGLAFGEDGKLLLVTEYDLDRHWIRTHRLSLDAPAQTPQLIFDRNADDSYHDPGVPDLRLSPKGFSVVRQQGSTIFLDGHGATPEGERPFLDRFDLDTLTSQRVFQCGPTSYERFVDWVVIEGSSGRFLTIKESPIEPPNLYERSIGASPTPPRAITAIADPTPQLRGIKKQIVKYQRKDGVELSFTLYLPPGYKAGTRLPTVVWAYPLDYADPKVAGQVVGSTQRFTTLAGSSPLFFLLDGYAVVDNPSLPVVGDPRTAYDHFVEQIVAGAEAAVAQAVAMGVTDPNRVGIGGHSHGALMTAVLLAHSNLFRAGVARSGAFNKTLTPFGFQHERRTLWDAPEVYVQASPFMLAHKIDEPLLLIHGDADANPGTIPLQSERLFEAIRGNKGVARLVLLPFESHGYQARESITHTLYEMISWFDRYVKRAAPRAATGDRSAHR